MSELTNEEIAAALNKMGHLGFFDWTFEIAARTQQLVFFSKTQLRSGSGPFSALYPETARMVVAYGKIKTALAHIDHEVRDNDLSDEYDEARGDEDLVEANRICDDIAGTIEELHNQGIL